MLRFLFDNEKDVIDIDKVKFNPLDVRHVKMIHEQIEKFNRYQNRLQNIDKTGAMLAGVTYTLLWITGCSDGLIGMISVPLLIVTTYFCKNLSFRNEVFHKFENQLKDLLNLYQWCGKNSRIQITKHPIFVELAKTISPYVLTSDLMIWGPLVNISSDDVSTQFLEIMATPPHHLQFVMQDEVGIFKLLKSPQKESTSHKEIVAPAHLSSFFANSLAELKRAIYSPNFHAVAKENIDKTVKGLKP